MMKRAALLLLVPVLLLASACNDDIGLDFGLSVRGNVANAATNQPIEGATVMVAGKTAVSAPNGNYFVPDLPRGEHTITVSKTGFVTYTGTVMVDQTFVDRTIPLVPAQ
jgi:hypothetical protein